MTPNTETATADDKRAVVFAGDYLNKLSGEQIERECRQRLNDGCTELVVNFSQTEIVNSIGVSILLGVIDSAKGTGARLRNTTKGRAGTRRRGRGQRPSASNAQSGNSARRLRA